MSAAEFAALVKDLRAAGIDFEPEIDRLPFLVRERAAQLRKRCYPALRWIEAMGKRSIWGTKYGWFRGCS